MLESSSGNTENRHANEGNIIYSHVVTYQNYVRSHLNGQIAMACRMFGTTVIVDGENSIFYDSDDCVVRLSTIPDINRYSQQNQLKRE